MAREAGWRGWAPTQGDAAPVYNASGEEGAEYGDGTSITRPGCPSVGGDG